LNDTNKTNILILTRKTKENANSIYNSYTNGIIENYPQAIVLDYFDLYFQNGKKKFEAEIFKQIAEHQINLVFINFVSGDLTFDLIFLQTITSKCFLLMNFYDTELFFEPIDRYYAQCADLVILPAASNFTHSYKLLGINAIATFSLFDTKLYKKQNLTKDIDISFVGDVSKKSRQAFLNYLLEAGYDVQIFGRGTKNGTVSFEKMKEIFSRSKINLNFSDTVEERNFNKHTNTDYSLVPEIMQYMTQLKGRSIESALCGGFVLTQYAIGIEEMFDTDEIAIFKDKKELIEKVKYYLNHDGRRKQMQEKAYQKALERYDASRAFSKILTKIDKHNRSKKTIYTDKEFLHNFASHHALYFFNFLFKLQLHYAVEEWNIMRHNGIKLTTLLKHLRQQFYYQIIRKILKRK